MSWSTSKLRVRLARWNQFKPSSKIFYWPFQGGTSCVDLECSFCLVFIWLCGHLPGNGWPLWSRLWCMTVSLSLSHRYPGSGVVLDCTGSWSLHLYLLSIKLSLMFSNIFGSVYFWRVFFTNNYVNLNSAWYFGMWNKGLQISCFMLNNKYGSYLQDGKLSFPDRF